MEVKNRSEAQMRTGKALVKAKRSNVGCKAKKGINREGPVTDPETSEISATSGHANQENSTTICINNLPQGFSVPI